MNTKYLIALLFLIVAAQATSVAVGDSQQFIKKTFYNILSVPSVVQYQNITANIQFNHIDNGQVNFYLSKTGIDPVDADKRSCTTQTCSVTWSNIADAADYQLSFAFDSDFSLADGKKITIGSLTVSGDGSGRANPILKQTIVVAPYKLHKVYFSAPGTITISLPYTTANQKAYYMQTPSTTDGPSGTNTNTVQFYSEDPSAFTLTQISVNSDNPVATESATLGTVTWTFNVTKSYHWIAIDPSTWWDLQTDNSKLSIDWTVTRPITFRMNYLTDVYTCPYLAEYPDNLYVFRGCQFQSDLSRLPCILYNQTLAVCTACYTGYTLSNGKCVEQDCPAGQYKKYGQCLTNPAGCDTYNDFTKCTKCSTGYNLNNGVCEKAPLTCTGRNYFNKATWTCDKVDDKCLEWAADTGACTSCISANQKPVSGKCVAADTLCSSTQYVNAALECVDINPLCQSFQKIGGKCIKCIWGYQYNTAQAKCIKIVCPTRYVPNDFGKCVKVSQLCAQYDARGNCLACIPTHVLQSDGVCLQIENPNQCPDRQYLGQDNYCHEVSEFCEIYNKDTGVCSKCVGNYYLMYTGECVLQKTCKSRQVLINNDCHDVSPTCGNYDRTNGKCLNCVSESYELYYGLCIPVSTCGPRQWSDANKNCFDVSARCNTFNPSTGDCTSCVQGYNYVNGICCLKTQFNSNGVCVDAKDSSSVTSNNGCQTYVNGIGCVRCSDGYTRAQDSLGFYICQKA